MKQQLEAKAIWRLRVAVKPESEDAISHLLESVLGQPASIYTDVRQDRSWATVYLSNQSGWTQSRRARIEAGLRNLVALGLPVPRIHVAVSRLANEDWAESWKRHFKPLAIGRDLLVLPSWSRRQPAPGQAVVILDPGLSFGTGNHPTTRFCLEELVTARVRERKSSFLDAGCGSGILAIAAAKVGYDEVAAFDFDPDAIRVASDNAVQNGVRARIQLSRTDLTRLPQRPPRTFDVVCANLTADLLVSEAGKLSRMISIDGRLLLAGILHSQFKDVQQVFAKKGFGLIRSRRQGEWRSGVFRRQ